MSKLELPAVWKMSGGSHITRVLVWETWVAFGMLKLGGR